MDQTAAPANVVETPRTSDTAIAVAAIAVLICSYCINAMDRTLFPLMLTDVRREYGFTLPQAGLMSTFFTLGMAFAGIPTGYLMSRYSRKTVIQVGILIYSATTIITVVAFGFADMLLYRAITGIGEAMQLTALLAVFSSYFSRYRAAGVGILNYAYAGGAAIGPALGAKLLVEYATWRAPMIIFGVIGLGMMALIAAVVRPRLSETNTANQREATLSTGGATTLKNLNTSVLVILSIIFGLALYGYLGMYPTFLREQLHYAPADAGRVMSIYGLGVLVSVVSGWLGDRFSPRLILGTSFLIASAIAALLFNGPIDFATQATLSLVLGATFSGTIFVNLAACHVKSVSADLAGRASGVFVTSLYGSATIAGYVIGWIVGLAGWTVAGNVQLVLLCLAGAMISLALRPERMAMRTA
ncbi:MAG: MFS transporter [Bradyrhizobium sp.]|jgi:DHA1 family inner membrane transport protein|uniref:MFS transporter n=1 Tax=Bradyrhizobium sp. TaxID=376 RepID=UPI0012136138|nr:MFS transporter [Bradyrhizobium sp.]THD46379.1 MAG: MFS transporter [Bradyrhizobium sp.]